MNSTRTGIARDSQKLTHTCSRTIFVSRFLRFWWKFSGKRARIASAEDRSRKATSLVKRCRAWSNCGKRGRRHEGTHGAGRSSAHSPTDRHTATVTWGVTTSAGPLQQALTPTWFTTHPTASSLHTRLLAHYTHLSL